MPTKFSTCLMNLFNQAHTKKISQLQCPQNPSQNSFNNITYCQHYQNSMSYQHCSRLHHVNSKCPQSQDYNMINHTMPQISKRAHNNKMTMSQHQTLNEAWTKKISQKKKKKTHLEVHVGMWSMGFGVLKDPLFIILFKWWMVFFFPWKVRKEGPLEDDAIVVQKEGKFGNGFHKMEMKQKWPRTERSKKILRMSEGKWRSLEKCFF